MTLVHLYYSPVSEFDRLFADALAARGCRGTFAPSREAKQAISCRGNVYRPRMDVHESKDANTVTATLEVPGLTSDSVTIDVHQNHLMVSGELIVSESEEDRNCIVRERSSGKFSRKLQLPFGTKPEDVKAKMENGILTITFPKASPEQQAKRIIIQ